MSWELQQGAGWHCYRLYVRKHKWIKGFLCCATHVHAPTVDTLTRVACIYRWSCIIHMCSNPILIINLCVWCVYLPLVGFLLPVMTALILKLFLGRKSMQWFIDLAAMINGSSPQRTQTTATTMTGKMTSSHTSLFSSHWWVRNSPRPCTNSTAVHKSVSSGSWISAVSNLWFRWGSDLGLSNQWAEVSSLNASSPSKASVGCLWQRCVLFLS